MGVRPPPSRTGCHLGHGVRAKNCARLARTHLRIFLSSLRLCRQNSFTNVPGSGVPPRASWHLERANAAGHAAFRSPAHAVHAAASSTAFSAFAPSTLRQIRVGWQQEEVTEAARLDRAEVPLIQREQSGDAQPLGRRRYPGIGNPESQVAILFDQFETQIGRASCRERV